MNLTEISENSGITFKQSDFDYWFTGMQEPEMHRIRFDNFPYWLYSPAIRGGYVNLLQDFFTIINKNGRIELIEREDITLVNGIPVAAISSSYKYELKVFDPFYKISKMLDFMMIGMTDPFTGIAHLQGESGNDYVKNDTNCFIFQISYSASSSEGRYDSSFYFKTRFEQLIHYPNKKEVGIKLALA